MPFVAYYKRILGCLGNYIAQYIRALVLYLFFAHAAFADPLYTNEHGQKVSLSNHPAQYLVLNYWAPWCSACKEEIPILNKFYQQQAKKVLLYGVDFDNPPEKELLNVMKEMHIQYPNLADDPREQLKLPDIPALPVTFIFDTHNQLIATLYGPQTYASLMKNIKV